MYPYPPQPQAYPQAPYPYAPPSSSRSRAPQFQQAQPAYPPQYAQPQQYPPHFAPQPAAYPYPPAQPPQPAFHAWQPQPVAFDPLRPPAAGRGALCGLSDDGSAGAGRGVPAGRPACYAPAAEPYPAPSPREMSPIEEVRESLREFRDAIRDLTESRARRSVLSGEFLGDFEFTAPDGAMTGLRRRFLVRMPRRSLTTPRADND